MKIKINGEEKNLEGEKLNITELLTVEKVEMPDMVSVQLNEEFLRQPDYDTTFLKDGDEINFLYFMGGGE
ncbi:MAG: sulfur carrier protein ThiS [Campylobacteraceae bacterium]